MKLPTTAEANVESALEQTGGHRLQNDSQSAVTLAAIHQPTQGATAGAEQEFGELATEQATARCNAAGELSDQSHVAPETNPFGKREHDQDLTCNAYDGSQQGGVAVDATRPAAPPKRSRTTQNPALPHRLPLTRSALLARLETETGVLPVALPWCPGIYTVPASVALAQLPLYREGYLYGIDASSAAAVHALHVQPGDHCLDLCCAPGAKLVRPALSERSQEECKIELFFFDLGSGWVI